MWAWSAQHGWLLRNDVTKQQRHVLLQQDIILKYFTNTKTPRSRFLQEQIRSSTRQTNSVFENLAATIFDLRWHRQVCASIR